MPAEIPGFVYDAARGRYFRIQENHRNTQHVALRAAPPGNRDPGNNRSILANGEGVGARYTRQVVEGQKRAREEEKRGNNRRRRRAGDDSTDTVQNQRGCRRLGDEIELQLRLRGPATTRLSASVQELIKQRYAASLSSRTVSKSFDLPASSTDAFAVDPVTKELFTCKRLGPDDRRHFCVTPLTDEFSIPGNEDETHDGTYPAYKATSGRRWETEKTIPILDAATVLAVSPISDGCAVWITQSNEDHYDDLNVPMLINVSTRYSSRGAEVPWANWRDDFGDWGTQTYTLRGRIAWNAVGNPARNGKMLLATSKGAMLGDINANGEFTDTGVKTEAMCVAWMDERLWLSGSRNGTVQMGDVRDRNATVARLRSAPGLAAVHGLRPRCDWGLLAWGLKTSSVYDLRWTKPASDTGLDSGPNRHPSRRKKVKDEIPFTEPLFYFESPESRQQRQYGKGFALDAQAGIVAAAAPNIYHSCVDLWDVTTGKILDGPLRNKQFSIDLKTLQFVDLDGQGDGSKSLLVGTRSRRGASETSAIIQAWEV